jgi:pyruvate/2-oxoglutarate dehydrogenase complex dihydrolipoamide dehydrogenase (E3) component
LTAQPRFAIVPSHEHKAFIPYTSLFSASPNPSLHSVVRACVLEVHPSRVVLDRPFSGSTSLEYDYLAIATGTRLPSPGSMQDEDKPLSVSYFQEYQKKVKTSQRIVILGGGAVGCQMACDILEVYPDKEVTLVQSREKVMSRFHEGLHEIVKKRFDELGVK